MDVNAAAISLAGNNFVVVLVPLELVQKGGEADMALDTLQGRFGVTVVLMGQREDGSPVYYGEEDLVRLLRDVSVDDMPWKEYSLQG